MTTAFTSRAGLLMILIAGVLAVPALGADREAVPVPAAPADMTYEGLRAVKYCEVWLFTGRLRRELRAFTTIQAR